VHGGNWFFCFYQTVLATIVGLQQAICCLIFAPDGYQYPVNYFNGSRSIKDGLFCELMLLSLWGRSFIISVRSSAALRLQLDDNDRVRNLH
jgi:hypothetical protein